MGHEVRMTRSERSRPRQLKPAQRLGSCECVRKEINFDFPKLLPDWSAGSFQAGRILQTTNGKPHFAEPEAERRESGDL